MDALNDLLGGDQRQEYDDFVQRYERGDPWDDISDDEAGRRYREVAPRLPSDEYEFSAEAAFKQLSPEQRAQFGRWLQTQERESSMDPDQRDYTDPRELALETRRVQQEQPGILEQMLGDGGTGGILANPIAKAALGGIAAIAMRKMMGR